MDRLTIVLGATVFGGVFCGAMLLWPSQKAPAVQARTSSSSVSPAPEAPLDGSVIPDLAPNSGERADFMPGNWQMRSHLGEPGVSLPNGDKDDLVVSTCMSEGEAAKPVKDKVLDLISRNSCKSEGVTVGGGSIGGTLTCPGSYDIREHPERLSGYYSRTALHVTVDATIYGGIMRQTIDFRRIGDCGK